MKPKPGILKKQKTEDFTTDWQAMDAESIIALINACNPWNKGAVTKMNNQVIRLPDAEKLMENSSLYKEPGYIIALEKNGMIVSAINDQAIIVRILYAEEGFLHASHLGRLGVAPVNRFEKI